MNSIIEPWMAAEFEYARRLKSAHAEDRAALYFEAYSAVARLRWGTSSDLAAPEERTAGTNRELAETIRALCGVQDDVIEFGAGRGFTAMVIAPHVRSYTATDVADPSLDETSRLLATRCPHADCRVIKCAGTEIIHRFPPASFSVALSIDVTEHLHPDDAREHYRQVLQILRPGGRYIISTPNRLSGPHDITRIVYPDVKEPLGFHLNESSYTDLSRELRRAGFSRIRAFSLQDQNGFIKTVEIRRKKLVELAFQLSAIVPRIRRRLQWRVYVPINLIATK